MTEVCEHTAIDNGRMRMPPLEPIPEHTVGKPFKLWIVLRMVRCYRLSKDWDVRMPDGKIVRLPEGFEHDGASFPPWLTAVFCGAAILFIDNPIYLAITLLIISSAMQALFNPVGIALVAGVVHDYLYQKHELPLRDGGYIFQGCSWYEADDLFKRIHINTNDMPFFGTLTYLGMRCGSYFVWRKYRKDVDLSKANKDQTNAN